MNVDLVRSSRRRNLVTASVLHSRNLRQTCNRLVSICMSKLSFLTSSLITSFLIPFPVPVGDSSLAAFAPPIPFCSFGALAASSETGDAEAEPEAASGPMLQLLLPICMAEERRSFLWMILSKARRSLPTALVENPTRCRRRSSISTLSQDETVEGGRM